MILIITSMLSTNLPLFLYVQVRKHKTPIQRKINLMFLRLRFFILNE